ncbi:MAG: T9SS C-terminal target domain-containing protein [Calditrichaeota bacterium]|nr:MAG: T9SS C-terminal target domain-containing protein [Calditrichota bacterium]
MSRDGETDPNFTLAADVSFPVPSTGIGDEEPPLATRFELYQNYPNPFNPSTTIRFSLTGAMDVRLEVFNLMGQKVATLVDGRLTAGEHQVKFDGRGLPSGIYLYRLTGNGITQTRRMVLMK